MGWLTSKRSPNRTLLGLIADAIEKAGWQQYSYAITAYHDAVEYAGKHRMEFPNPELLKLRQIYSQRALKELRIYESLAQLSPTSSQFHRDEARKFAKAANNKTVEDRVKEIEDEVRKAKEN